MRNWHYIQRVIDTATWQVETRLSPWQTGMFLAILFDNSCIVIVNTLYQCTQVYRFYKHLSPKQLTYVDLGPPVFAGTMGDVLSPSIKHGQWQRSWLYQECYCHWHPFLAYLSRHVRFGPPHLLLPPSRVQSVTKLTGLDVRRRCIFPMNYASVLRRFRDIITYFSKLKEVTWPRAHPFRE